MATAVMGKVGYQHEAAAQQFASIRKSLYFHIEGPGTAAHPRPLPRMAPLEREEPPVCDCNRIDSPRPGESCKLPSQIPSATSYALVNWCVGSPTHAHSAAAPIFHQCTRGELLVNSWWTKDRVPPCSQRRHSHPKGEKMASGTQRSVHYFISDAMRIQYKAVS